MGKVSVTDFTATYATLRLSLTRRERWEVIVKKESLRAVVKHVVNDFLIELSAKCHCCKSLSLTAGEHCRSVRSGQIVGFTPDGANLVGLTAIEANTLIENTAAHSLLLYIVIVALHERSLLLTLLLRNSLDKLIANSIEAVLTPVLVS